MVVQRLDELDRSAIGFPEQLYKLLHDKQWVKSLKLLPEGELGELIDFLNNVHPTPSPTESHLPSLGS